MQKKKKKKENEFDLLNIEFNREITAIREVGNHEKRLILCDLYEHQEMECMLVPID